MIELHLLDDKKVNLVTCVCTMTTNSIFAFSNMVPVLIHVINITYHVFLLFDTDLSTTNKYLTTNETTTVTFIFTDLTSD